MVRTEQGVNATIYRAYVHILLLPSAYHGHLSSLIDISPYKFRNLDGQKEWVHVVRTPTISNRSVSIPKPG